jgi:hypothetical protein
MYKTCNTVTIQIHSVRKFRCGFVKDVGGLFLCGSGPKMIYHFWRVGWDTLYLVANNGTVNTPNDTTPEV